jgi:hypothetical protein
VHLSGNLILDSIKFQIRQHLQPRKRIKDLYDKINVPDDADEDELSKEKSKKLDLSEGIKNKLKKYDESEAIGGGK